MNIKTTLDDRLKKLKTIITRYNKACIGFSGGVDSTLLLYLVDQMIPTVAVTADGAMVTRSDIAEACAFTQTLENTEHILLPIDAFTIDEFVKNKEDRCYHCKLAIFSQVQDVAQKKGCDIIFDGANVDDLGDYRPGMKATEELGVVSPFLEAGLTKSDIYYLSKKYNLPTQDKPSAACLASRIPTDEPIDREKLAKVEQGEAFLRDLGFDQLRLRLRNGTEGQVECSSEDFSLFESNREKIIQELEKLKITVDPEPKAYKQGSMNKVSP